MNEFIKPSVAAQDLSILVRIRGDLVSEPTLLSVNLQPLVKVHNLYIYIYIYIFLYKN